MMLTMLALLAFLLFLCAVAEYSSARLVGVLCVVSAYMCAPYDRCRHEHRTQCFSSNYSICCLFLFLIFLLYFFKVLFQVRLSVMHFCSALQVTDRQQVGQHVRDVAHAACHVPFLSYHPTGEARPIDGGLNYNGAPGPPGCGRMPGATDRLADHNRPTEHTYMYVYTHTNHTTIILVWSIEQ